MSDIKVAFVHEWLVNIAGSERVLAEMLKVFPYADVYSVIDYLDSEEKQKLGVTDIKTTFIQRLPFARKLYKYYLTLMPLAIEQLDLGKYDIVISSSHAVAKGVITDPAQLHICMCYSPMRYLWDMQNEYLAASKLTSGFKSWITRFFFHKLRTWDVISANRVDKFIAISKFISWRIQKVYRRNSVVIYPSVDTQNFIMQTEKEDFYLAVSRMVPYKRMDLIVKAFTMMPDKQLVVIGDGPGLKKIKTTATKNITILGFQNDDKVKQYLSKAKAFVFAAKEDFGIALVEAQACGTPVIAYAKGGALEIVKAYGTSDLDFTAEEASGIFFSNQTVESLCETVKKFENIQGAISPENCRKNAERFSAKRFQHEFKQFVDESWKEFLDVHNT